MEQIVRRKAGDFRGPKPEILAPAGQKDSFLAALAAGADAVYCGLKDFSARMAAQNFTPAELAALIDLAHDQGAKVYLTVNTLLKSDELLPLGRQLAWVSRHAAPDALIVQDLAVPALARQAGFSGEIHLSTLANVSHPAVLSRLGTTLNVQRVVLPRELNVDEIKQMAAACPPDLGLELFVHGALCYGVSGRCYWSSFMGGKSGLRGRCVQPCRRRYTQGEASQRFFSCQDYSLDVLAKVLAEIPQVRAWKIEGRKKGPHYVYYTTTAYKMLRDEGQDPQAKKSALGLLENALGRPGTHYHFLPQRPQNPIDTQTDSGSGLLVGTVRGGRDKPCLEPRMALLEGDKLRIGYEDDEWHQTFDLPKSVPKGGKFYFKTPKGRVPAKGTPIFLIDRREPYLLEQIAKLQRRLDAFARTVPEAGVPFNLRLAPASPKQPRVRLMHVLRSPGQRMRKTTLAVWLSAEAVNAMHTSQITHAWWWLPPVIWPDEEEQWRLLIRKVMGHGADRFVLNAPWQVALFQRSGKLNLWAGPFCNIANPLAIRTFKLLGGQGVIVSPELGQEDYEALSSKSVLPLGAVIYGHWPFCVSRTAAADLQPEQPFESPRQEQGWLARYGSLNWVFPNWPIDLRGAQDTLAKAGYRLFVQLEEPVPRSVQIKKRPGKWNWELGLR
ncbi:U32 family peptidase [Desulfatitalea alkaliphila]|uniref:U32 family peptidase n=1 Tax=Desulfatitalea alkaliphila TaxID=2929485 RepID=A0AA41R883_9BACT|nr:U32 family peptidase [Desulfatitalea alkaliphila]MCJ8502811.1 U32 family peptidase [Desulfatitalea alkaliphila]